MNVAKNRVVKNTTLYIGYPCRSEADRAISGANSLLKLSNDWSPLHLSVFYALDPITT